jgi:hypothetical protein
VGFLILAVVFLLTLAIGTALAKGVLTLVLHLAVHRPLPALAVERAAR